MPDLSVNFKIELSPKASEFIRRSGAPKELAMQIAAALNDEDSHATDNIKQRLNVQGAGKHRRGSKRGIAESETGDYIIPHKITGHLRDSMGFTLAVIDGFSGGGGISRVRAAIGSGVGFGGESVRYAAIQEFGGTIHVPSRASKSKKYRRTYTMTSVKYQDRRTGRFISEPKTKAHDVNIPARPYLSSTLSMRKDRWPRRISRVVKDFYGGNV